MTFVAPTFPGHVGPGFTINVTSDFVGPLPTGSRWIIDLTPPGDDDDVRYRWIYPTGVPSLVRTIGFTTTPAPQWNVALGDLNDGEDVRLVARLQNNLGVDLDTGSQVNQFDTRTGLPYFLTAIPMTSTGAFTTADREELHATLAGLRVSVPALGAAGGFVIKTLGELFGALPPQITHRGTSVLISGQGSFARGVAPMPDDCVGLEWHWNVIPPGFGKTLGAVDEFGRRIVQWRLIDQDVTGQLYQRDFRDSDTEGERWMFGVSVPATIEFYVAPGCVVEVAFLRVLP